MNNYGYSAKELNQFGVYRIVNVKNGEVYIGSTSLKFKTRWEQHLHSLKKQKHHNSILQNKWNFYGERSFLFEIAEIVLDKNDVISTEQKWLDFAFKDGKCINVRPLAESPLGFKMNQEGRTKISNGMKKAWADLSKKDEWKQSLAGNGYRLQQIVKNDPEVAKKKSDGLLRAWQNPDVREKHLKSTNDFYDSPESQQARQEISIASRSYWDSPNGQANIARRQKTYIGVVSPDGVPYSPITNLSKFAKEHNLDIRSLRHLVNGRQMVYKGWVAMLYEGEIDAHKRVAFIKHVNLSNSQRGLKKPRKQANNLSPNGQN